MLRVGDRVTKAANELTNVPEFSGVIKRFWRFDANRTMVEVCTGAVGAENCILTCVSNLRPTLHEPGATDDKQVEQCISL
jgi:hypothetical protein